MNAIVLLAKKLLEYILSHDCLSLQDKCYQYWPDQGCWTYGSVRVAVEDFTVLVDYTIRKFCIQYVSVMR